MLHFQGSSLCLQCVSPETVSQCLQTLSQCVSPDTVSVCVSRRSLNMSLSVCVHTLCVSRHCLSVCLLNLSLSICPQTLFQFVSPDNVSQCMFPDTVPQYVSPNNVSVCVSQHCPTDCVDTHTDYVGMSAVLVHCTEGRHPIPTQGVCVTML